MLLPDDGIGDVAPGGATEATARRQWRMQRSRATSRSKLADSGGEQGTAIECMHEPASGRARIVRRRELGGAFACTTSRKSTSSTAACPVL
jgi:hypothetical protein